MRGNHEASSRISAPASHSPCGRNRSRRHRGTAGARPGTGCCAAKARQDRIHQHIQRPDRGDRQRHAQLVGARARSSRPQDGWPAGGGRLRGRPAEAGGRQAEDREAGAVRQGGFRGRLHLVERAARLAQARAGCPDVPDQRQCRPAPDRRRDVLALLLLDLLAERPDPAGGRRIHEPERGEVGLPARAELRRRQGHAGRRAGDLQGQGASARTSPSGRTSSTFRPSSPR